MRADVAAALRGRVVDQRRMVELLLAANVGKRADSRRTWEAIVWAFVCRADWATGAITAPHEAVAADAGAACDRLPFSHDTIGRFVAAAVAAGVLVCPEGLGGMSRAALGGADNQCPTYFVVDPAAPVTCEDADLRTPQSHVSETVPLRETKALYEGRNFPKFANFDPTAVPATAAERRRAAEYLRSELHIGAVPNWRVAAMMARHFNEGLSPSKVFRRVCTKPDGAVRRSLPIGEAERAAALAQSPRGGMADMLLGMIGARLREWRGVPERATRPAPRPAPLPPAGPRTPPRSPDVLALFASAGFRVGALRG